MHGAKTTKMRPRWYILLDYFTTKPSFKTLNIVFDQVVIDAENV